MLYSLFSSMEASKRGFVSHSYSLESVSESMSSLGPPYLTSIFKGANKFLTHCTYSLMYSGTSSFISPTVVSFSKTNLGSFSFSMIINAYSFCVLGCICCHMLSLGDTFFLHVFCWRVCDLCVDGVLWP